jgi:hypothetical protein
MTTFFPHPPVILSLTHTTVINTSALYLISFIQNTCSQTLNFSEIFYYRSFGVKNINISTFIVLFIK